MILHPFLYISSLLPHHPIHRAVLMYHASLSSHSAYTQPTQRVRNTRSAHAAHTQHTQHTHSNPVKCMINHEEAELIPFTPLLLFFPSFLGKQEMSLESLHVHVLLKVSPTPLHQRSFHFLYFLSTYLDIFTFLLTLDANSTSRVLSFLYNSIIFFRSSHMICYLLLIKWLHTWYDYFLNTLFVSFVCYIFIKITIQQ